jgi:predicted homoserine dehydrogenase-like protein
MCLSVLRTDTSAPVCEVAATAKRDLKAGEVLHSVGGFMTYGVIENAPAFLERSLLPMGIVEGCRLLRDLVKDDSISYADVELPKGRLCDRLRSEQAVRFGLRKSA